MRGPASPVIVVDGGSGPESAGQQIVRAMLSLLGLILDGLITAQAIAAICESQTPTQLVVRKKGVSGEN